MICGAAQQARWFAEQPRFTFPHSLLERVVQIAFPTASIIEIQPLHGGFRNANFKINLNSVPDSIVLRVYEHDSSLCQKEMDLLRLIGGCVPVPEMIYAEPKGWDDFPPFTLVRYIQGITFHELKRRGDPNAIAQAARSVGETLATIGQMTFSRSGWLSSGLCVMEPHFETANAVPHFIDDCLESPNLCARVPSAVRKLVSSFAWSMRAELAELGPQTQLVHGDFGKRNVLVKLTKGRWRVAAILDWEFALSGTPLADLGRFLRYERRSRPVAEPQFSASYLEAGGKLRPGWRQLAGMIDLTALCESLTHDELPAEIVMELVGLVRATVENREPELS